MTEELANKLIDAYKTYPLLTGLLLLNFLLIAGFGWWEFRRVSVVDAFVQQQLKKQDELQKQLVEMARSCAMAR